MKRKFGKILIITSAVIITLIFAAWQTFNHYWRTNQTFDTFTTFTEPDSLSFTDIIWHESSFGSIHTAIGSFLVKVQLNGIDDSFYMQFDTGTPRTMLYGRTLKKLKEKYPSLKTGQSKNGNTYFSSVQLKIADVAYEADSLRILPNMGSNILDSSFNIIGTVGYDAIVGRKLILDFKNNHFAITNKSFEELGDFRHVEGASVDRFPILLPAKVNDEEVQLWYDTGSSMFSLLLANNKLAALDNAGAIDTLCCTSAWGKSYEFYRREIEGSISIGDLNEQTPQVYASEVMNEVAYFPNWFMMGITGNHIFLDKIILVDTENNVFGISN